ncbi:MAG: 8-oxo-dGTP diphosphatase [Verrucomicrobiales bacterium]
MSQEPSPVDWESWVPEVPATLMFVIRDGRVLLIVKKRGLGAGKINGPGGKIDPGETPLACVIRETQEELEITPLNPVKLGELWFSMGDIPDILCHVYRAEDFSGTPVETDEAIPLWVDVNAIPYEQMWADDELWLPLLLSGTTFIGRFVFAGDDLLWNRIETGLRW